MKHTLIWFQQNFKQEDAVTYNVETEREGRSTFGDDYRVANSELESLAKARGASTWDESDILAYHTTKYGETVTLAEAPKREEIVTNGE